MPKTEPNVAATDASTREDLIDFLEDMRADARLKRRDVRASVAQDFIAVPEAQRPMMRDSAPALMAKHDDDLASLDRFLAYLRGS